MTPLGYLAIGVGTAAAGGVAAYAVWRMGVRQRIVRAAIGVTPSKREDFVNGTLVSQGRAFTKGYSSCGDLINYVMNAVGAAPSFVNRDDPTRGLKWKSGVNIAKPVAAAKAAGAWVDYAPGKLPKAGDLVLIGQYPTEQEHVFVVTGTRPGNTITTAEYGGTQNAGHREVRTISADGKIGARKVIGWIDADKIPRMAA